MAKVFILWITLLLSFNVFAQVNCDALDNLAQQQGIRFDSAENGYQVKGEGRAYFYSAPTEGCEDKKIFIIHGDNVNVYLDYNNYFYVMYFTKNGKQVSGWVKSDRLKSNGTGVGGQE